MALVLWASSGHCESETLRRFIDSSTLPAAGTVLRVLEGLLLLGSVVQLGGGGAGVEVGVGVGRGVVRGSEGGGRPHLTRVDRYINR